MFVDNAPAKALRDGLSLLLPRMQRSMTLPEPETREAAEIETLIEGENWGV